ncbi:MAG TPA: cytochrome c [Acidobacteriaceae bacterium]|nr:cytochrome c [Acidobacteriaceae bacterium]
MRHVDRVIAGLLLLAAAAAAGQAGNGPKQQPQKPEAADRLADRGQRVFSQNCARCHNPPEGFSPAISRTLATHMRVRAGLSEQDYKALLKYFNP